MDKWKSTERLTFQSALNQNNDYSLHKSINENNPRISTSLRSNQRISKSNYDESKEYEPKSMSNDKEIEKTHLNKKRPLVLMNKYHLLLASYIQDHKSDVKFSGTKRFCDKSGEYYLKNVLIEKNPQNAPPQILPKLSLKEPTNLINCIIKCNGLQPLSNKASEIQTKLPKNSLTPIPMMNKKSIKSSYEGKELSNAERTAVHIRRLEYSTEMNRLKIKPMSKKLSSIIIIQQWWKTIFSFIRIQRFFRGWIFRKKLMNYLDHEEALIEKILSIEKNCNKQLMKRFVWKLTGETNYNLRSLIPIKSIFVNQAIPKKNWQIKSYHRLKLYFDKWRNRRIEIKKRKVVLLLKGYFAKKALKIKLINQEKIKNAIEHIKTSVVKRFFTLLKNNHNLCLKKKEKTLKTFENKLLKLKDKETEVSTLQTLPYHSSTVTIEHSMSSSSCNDKENDREKNLLKLKRTQAIIIKGKESNSKDDEKIICLHQPQNKYESTLLKNYFDLWQTRCLKIRMIKKASRLHRSNKFIDKLRDSLNKWKRYVNYKFNQLQIASLLIILNHNKESNKEPNKEYSNKFNNPIILDFPLTNKVKKDISSISEREENESSIDNTILSHNQTPIKNVNLNIEQSLQKNLEKNKSKTNNKDNEKKRDTISYVYLKKKPAYNLSLDNYIQERDHYYSNSNSEGEQLDKNANQIEYDESLTSKEQKIKGGVSQNSLVILYNSFEIISANSNKSFKDNETNCNNKEIQTERMEKKDIGVDTKDIYKDIMLQQIIMNKRTLASYFTSWKNIVKPCLSNDQLNKSNINTNYNNKKNNSYDYSRSNNQNLNSIEDNDLIPMFQTQTNKIKGNQINIDKNKLTYKTNSCKNILSNNNKNQVKNNTNLRSHNNLPNNISRNINAKNISNKDKDNNTYIVNLKNQFDTWRDISTKKKITQVLNQSEKTIKSLKLLLKLNTLYIKKSNKCIKIFSKANIPILKKYLNKWRSCNRIQNQCDNFLFIVKTVIVYNSQKTTLAKIKENDLKILCKNVLQRWNSKRILPKIISIKSKKNILQKLQSKKELNSLYEHYIYYYNQTKALSLEEMKLFALKIQKEIKQNYFNHFLNKLSQKKNNSKRLMLKSCLMHQKPKTDYLLKLGKAFFIWKSRLRKNDFPVANDLIKKSHHNENEDETMLKENLKKSSLSKTLNNPLTFRHQTETSHNLDKDINIDKGEDNEIKESPQLELDFRKAFKNRYNYQYNRGSYVSSSSGSERYKFKNCFTENSRVDFKRKKKDSENTKILSGRPRSFDLIETKNEILKPIIYSSQSFYFTKERSKNENSKIKLHSNFYSMFKFPNIEKGQISNLKNPRIQVTKATIPYDDENNKIDSNLDTEKEIQNSIMNHCQHDLQSTVNDNDRIKSGYHFTFPIKEPQLINIDTEINSTTDQIKKLALVNYDNIMTINKSPKYHRRYKSESLNINTNIKLNYKSHNNQKNSFDRQTEEDQTFQFKEINHTQYYHSPITLKHNKNQDDFNSGIYTNISKSIKRGKMPIFHKKQLANMSIDVLSSTQNNNNESNKFDSVKQLFNPLYLSSTFYESCQSQPSISNGLDVKIKEKGSQMNNQSLTNQIFNNNDFGLNDTTSLSQSQTQGNIFSHNTHIYSHRVLDTISPSLSYTFTDDFNHNYKQNLNNYINTMPKIIQSKTIWFKNLNENKNTWISNSQNHQVSMKINWGFTNFLLLKQFYEKIHKRFLLNRLVTLSLELNDHINLCYLLKVTLVHRSSTQVNSIKELLISWRNTLKRHNKKAKFTFKSINSFNSMIFIGGKDDK